MNAPLTTIDLGLRVEQYIKLRDVIKAEDDAHKEKMKPLRETLEQLNAVLLSHLNNMGATNASTDHGTVYKTTKESASIADQNAFWTYVVATGKFDLMDKKANVVAVRAFIEEQAELAKNDPNIQQGPPPGVNYTITDVVGVRRR